MEEMNKREVESLKTKNKKEKREDKISINWGE